ncbi:MAG: hypothetical protein ABMA26_04585 [Limisphaerales bacterium]
MSGPKCVVVAPIAPALIPIAILIGAAAFGAVALANLASNYLEQRRLLETLRQQRDYLDGLLTRMRGLGIETEALQSTVDIIMHRADDLAREGKADAAVALVASEIAGIDNQRRAAENRLECRVADLQRRFHALPTRAGELRRNAERIETFARSAIPGDWPAAERERLLARAREACASVSAPASIAADLSANGVEKLEAAESQLAAAARSMAALQRALEDEINAVQKRLMADKLGLGAARTVSLAEFLAKNPRPAAAAADADEDRVLQKLDGLLAKMAVLQDTGGWADLMRRVETVRAEEDVPRRRTLYESLVLEASRRLKDLRAVEQWLAEVDALLAESAPYAGTAVDAVVAELREVRRAGRITALEPWKQRLAETQQRELARLERERKRRAILESLTELGYETNEGMETALVQAGKLVVRKPGESDYAVEVVANNDLSMLQTAMVRYSDSEEMTEQQRLRDHEREEAWCADHARIREKMAARGLSAKFKMQMPAGSHPVRVVKRDQAAPASRAKAKPGLKHGA